MTRACMTILAAVALLGCEGGSAATDAAPGAADAARDAATPPIDAPADAAGAAGDDAGGGPVFDGAGATAVFCEDFEDLPDFALAGDATAGEGTAPAGSGWTDVHVGAHDTEPSNRSTLERDESRAHRGAASLRSRIEYHNAITAWAEMRQHVEARPEIFVRLFAYVPAATIGSQVAIAVWNEDGGSYYGAMGLALDEEGHLATYGYGDTHTGSARDPEVVPTDRWICLEMRMEHGGADPAFEAWRDGAPIVTGISLAPLGDRVLERAVFGLYGGSNEGLTAEVGIDDVVIATERVGCDR